MDIFKKPKPKRADPSFSWPTDNMHQPFAGPSSAPRFTNPFRKTKDKERGGGGGSIRRGFTGHETPTQETTPPAAAVQVGNPFPLYPATPEEEGVGLGISTGEIQTEEESVLDLAREEVPAVSKCFSENWNTHPFGTIWECQNPGCGLPQIGFSVCGNCGKGFCLKCWEKRVDVVH